MTSRGRSALGWGVVGVLSFLVFHGAYLLVGGEFLGFGPVGSVAAAVFALATVATYALEGRLGPAGAEEEERWPSAEGFRDEGSYGGASSEGPAGEPPGERVREERMKTKETLEERLQDGSE